MRFASVLPHSLRRLATLSAFASAAFVASSTAAQQPPPRRPPPVKRAPVPAAKKVDSTVAKDTTKKKDATPAAPAAAPKPVASITGTVFDSVHAMPLAGATVLVEGANRGGITTRLGIFLVDSIPPGSGYRVHVQHPFLDSIGILMRTDSFSLADGDGQMVKLGVPSPATLVAISCPPARRALGPSAVLGKLLDADSDAPVEGARVSVAWLEMSLNAGLRKVPRLREALSGADGVFRICGLPAEMEGTLQAQLKGINTSEVRLKFEGQPLIVQGLRIGNAQSVVAANDTAAMRRQKEASAGPQFSAVTLARGNAALTGRVVNANGQPIVGARVDVLGTPGATLTSAGGEFSLTGLPSGTQSVVVRQIGYAPEERAVDLSTRAAARVEVKMERPAAVLNTVVVKADRDVGLEKIGFTQRKRSGGGYYITADDISRRAPNILTDVFRSVPGLRVSPSGNGTDYTIESSRSATGGCVRYWVDGAVFEAV
ncbi:MAG: carboxypeptidase regulatory-like domain-containing protein, partial [Gemmatimonadaceae bacterium]